MARPRLPASNRRVKMTVTLPPEVVAWLDSHSGFGNRFKDRTHAIEYAISLLMEETRDG